jgi:hypothetical protein
MRRKDKGNAYHQSDLRGPSSCALTLIRAPISASENFRQERQARQGTVKASPVAGGHVKAVDFRIIQIRVG